MKLKTTIMLICLLAFNTGTTAQSTEPPKQQQQVNIQKQLIHASMRHDLQQAVTKALSQAQKTRYVFSGDTPAGWDCSGLVRWVYKQAGIVLPHSADKQGHLGTRVSTPKRGDIVVFAYQGRTDFYHAAIYLGDGLILNANREYRTTVIEPLNNFRRSQIRFIRVL